MATVEREIDRVLSLLRNKMRERGYTQLEVQKCLNWGRSYISQILTKQKALRLEQVLLILGVIGVDPGEFFEELYTSASAGRGGWRDPAGAGSSGISGALPDLSRSVTDLRSLVRGLVALLVDREVIGVEDLSVAVHATSQAVP